MSRCHPQLRRIQSSADVKTLAEQLRAHELRTDAAGAARPAQTTDSGQPAATDSGDGHRMRTLSMSTAPSTGHVALPDLPLLLLA